MATEQVRCRHQKSVLGDPRSETRPRWRPRTVPLSRCRRLLAATGPKRQEARQLVVTVTNLSPDYRRTDTQPPNDPQISRSSFRSVTESTSGGHGNAD